MTPVILEALRPFAAFWSEAIAMVQSNISEMIGEVV
jgi:hypothetical protein